MDEVIIYKSESEEYKHFCQEFVSLSKALRDELYNPDRFLQNVIYNSLYWGGDVRVLCFGDLPLRLLRRNRDYLVPRFGFPYYEKVVPACWFVDIGTKESSGTITHYVKLPHCVNFEEFDLKELLIFVNDKDGFYTSHLVNSVYDDLAKMFNFSGEVYASKVLEDNHLSILCLQKLCRVVLDKIHKYSPVQHPFVPPSTERRSEASSKHDFMEDHEALSVVNPRKDTTKTFLSFKRGKSSSKRSLKSYESSIEEKEKAVPFAEDTYENVLCDLFSLFSFMAHETETRTYPILRKIALRMLHDPQNYKKDCAGSSRHIIRVDRKLKETEKELRKEILKQYFTEHIELKYECECDEATKIKLDEKSQEIVNYMEFLGTPHPEPPSLFFLPSFARSAWNTLLSVGSLVFPVVQNVNSSEWREEIAMRLTIDLKKYNTQILDLLKEKIKKQKKNREVKYRTSFEKKFHETLGGLINAMSRYHVTAGTRKTFELEATGHDEEDFATDSDDGDGDDSDGDVQQKMSNLQFYKDGFTKLLQKLDSKCDEGIPVYTYEDYKKEKSMRKSCTKLISMPDSKVVSCWPGKRYLMPKTKTIQEHVLVAYTIKEVDIVEVSGIKKEINYRVLFKKYGDDSEEEKRIYGKENDRSNRMPRWTRNLIQSVINKYSRDLMKQHSNLSFVKPSSFLSHKNGLELESKSCIVLYCTCKGVVPLGEREFPKVLDNYPVDVREGIALPCGAQNFCDPLSMGCSIGLQGKPSAGSLGIFVQEKAFPQKGGFITCCHVLFGTLFNQQLRRFVNQSHCNGMSQYSVVQEADIDVQESLEMTNSNSNASNGATSTKAATFDVRKCGVVRDIFYGNCNVQLEGTSGAFIDVGVDAAYVEITKRSPKMATFAERDQTNHRGKCICDCQIGDILEELSEEDENHILHKCGRTSQFTKGLFESMGDLQIYKDPKDLSKGFTYLPNQYMILSTHEQPFLDHGDSGAAVFINKGGKLRCIGIGVSKSNVNGKFAFVTPIKAVFTALQPVLEAKRFHLKNNNYRF